MDVKTCVKCEQEQPVELFRLRKMAGGRQVPHSWCKPCEKAYKAGRYQANKTDIVAKQKKRYHEDPVYREGVKARNSRQREKNPDYSADYKRERRRRDSKFRAAVYARTSDWKRRNPHKNRQYCQNYMRKRSGQVSSRDWMSRLEEFNWHCCYCLTDLSSLPSSQIHMEHMSPVSLGGPHHISNIVPACRSCNTAKGAKTLLQFAASHLFAASPS